MLYSDHIEECNAFAQASPDNLRRCCQFVLATIQQQLETVPAALTSIVEQGSESKYAWGIKRAGVEWLQSQMCIEQLYGNAIDSRERPERLLNVFLRVPGLALVKAGFLCQIFDNAVGCIDLHNVKIYDIPVSNLRYRNEATDVNKAAKRARYVGLCEGLGGSTALWSRWCDYVAKLRPQNWLDDADVSQFHVDVITGKETGAIVDLFSDVEYEPTFRQ